MKHMVVTLFTIALPLGVQAGSTATAGLGGTAEPVAGWDFSQYAADGQLTTDGTTYVDTLPANYSSLDPTSNAGTEAAAIGTMYIDGQFGSSSIDPSPMSSPPILPSAGQNNCERKSSDDPNAPEGCTPPNVDGPIRSNRLAPANQPGRNPFDSLNVLAAEGQAYQNRLALTANSAVSVVFRADLGSLGSSPTRWGFSMGARSSQGTSTIGIDFAPDCGSYGAAGSFDVGEADERFTRGFGDALATSACVRLNFPNPGAGQAWVDNVVVHTVPEPAAAATASAACAALLSLARLRRSRA